MPITDELANLEEQLLEERKKVDVSSHDFSVRELVRMLSESELSITPEYQRKYRWKPAVASTFLESILLGLPIPPIFVATNSGFEWEVVDGLQRLSTLLYFVSDDPAALKIINRRHPLALEDLQKLSQLNGKRYRDLPPNIQRYFGRQPLQVISLTDKSDKSVRFDLFERLNAGSVALTPQEVRACIYRGQFNDFLEKLSEDMSFRALLKVQESNRHDGTFAEEVLKYFAYKNSAATFDGRVKEFLNIYMETASNEFDYTAERDTFQEATKKLLEATSGEPLIRRGANITPRVQFEACLVGVAKLIEEGREVLIPSDDWIHDPELLEASKGGSNTRQRLERRINRAIQLFTT
ncbi:MAG TPA: DUF262 domain-containing protein [Aldersonia sp.]